MSASGIIFLDPTAGGQELRLKTSRRYGCIFEIFLMMVLVLLCGAEAIHGFLYVVVAKAVAQRCRSEPGVFVSVRAPTIPYRPSCFRHVVNAVFL